MPSKLRAEEEWARSMIQLALGVPVVQHDDGSRPRMHDLDIAYPDRPRAAVEATAAADPACIELWNVFNSGGRWIADGIQGGWWVELDPTRARARRLRPELPTFLGQLERLGIRLVRPRSRPSHLDSPVDALARDLGISSAGQSGTEYPGSIYITLDLPSERSGGFVADTGDALALWLSGYLQEPGLEDVRAKLAASGAVERHAFIYLPGFTTAPFSASDLLMRPGAPLPTIDPELPEEITSVWVVSSWSTGDGFRWSPEAGWERFAKALPEGAGSTA